MNEKQIERLKKIMAESSGRIEDAIKLKAKEVLGQLIKNLKKDNKKD